MTTFERRYFDKGTWAHLRDPAKKTILCGAGRSYLGAGDDTEREKASSMPLCPQCAAAQEARS